MFSLRIFRVKLFLRRACADHSTGLLVSAATLLVVVPFLTLGIPGGDDFAFHMATWLEAAEHHTLPPRWAAAAYFGFGDARFMFYPPLSWMLGGVLFKTLPLAMGPPLFLLIGALLAGYAMHALARRLITQRESIIAGVFFALSPYGVHNIYPRAAYAEILATPIFLLCIHFLLRVYNTRSRRYIGLLGLSLGLVWLTEIPVALIAGLTVVVLATVLWWTGTDRQFPLRLAGAGLIGIGVSAFYTFGVLSGIGWIDTEVFNPHVRDLGDFTLSRPFWAIACIQGLASAWLVVRLYRNKTRQGDLRWVAVVFTLLPLFMLLPISIPIWRLPPIGFIQFPTRWLLVLAVPYSLAAALVMARRPCLLAVGSVLGVVVVLASPLIAPHGGGLRWIADERTDIRRAPDYGGLPQSGPRVSYGAFDWSPRTFHFRSGMETWPLIAVISKTGKTGSGLPGCTSLQDLQIKAWEAEQKVIDAACDLPATLRFRLAFCPLWRITLNGSPVDASHDEYGALEVQMPAGRNRIEVHLQPSVAQVLGTWCSIFTCVLLMALVCGL